MSDKNENKKTSSSLVTQIIKNAVSGNKLLNISSAKDLANSYINDKSYKNNDERAISLINWETSKNFASGFVTGLGGLITLPVTLPSSLVAAWIIQARLCAAIAFIYGYDLDDDKVKILILISILGDAGKEILKDVGIKVGKEITVQLIKNLTPKIIKEVSKQIGFRLLTRAGQKSLITNLGKGVPIVGGFIGGSIDAVACQTVGRTAQVIFKK